MNGSRITSDDTSRVSLAIGLGIAVVAIGAIVYFIFVALAASKEVTGFDPKRPIPSDAVLRKRLKTDQYHVVRENGTETAFKNDYWDKYQPGVYVDIITGEPLFSSQDKFDGQTGRPTFSKPISNDLIVERPDNSHDMQRTEVRAHRSDAHLGHVFDDPASPTHRRYTLNSAALRFIPLDKMDAEGYGDYLKLFDQKK